MTKVSGASLASVVALTLCGLLVTACGDDSGPAAFPDGGAFIDAQVNDSSVTDAGLNDAMGPTGDGGPDILGPTIEVSTPEPSQLVSGVVTFRALVTDPDGVDLGSVRGTIAGTHEFPLTNTTGDEFIGTFDTEDLAAGLIFPTVVIRAKDAAGNQSSVGFVVALDNVPPVADLDPPPVREALQLGGPGGPLECGVRFDPLGGGSVRHGMTLFQLSHIRVRVEDFGNDFENPGIGPPGVHVPYAGIEPTRVELFVLDDETGALIVDTDGDGVCDAINPLLVPTSTPTASNEAAVVQMAAIEDQGQSAFIATGGAGFDPFLEPGASSSCVAPVATIPGSTRICQQAPGTRVIRGEKFSQTGKEQIVYGIPPLEALQCWGNAFDSVATNISGGWACMAVRTEDRLGNVGVSPVISVCNSTQGFDCADLSATCYTCPTLAPHCGTSERVAAPCDGTPGTIQENRPVVCTGTYNSTTNTVDTGTPCAPPKSFSSIDPTHNLMRLNVGIACFLPNAMCAIDGECCSNSCTASTCD